jgi:peptidoglycan L-alanyl-D-glutamate endopeptidase CwlK
MKNNREKIRVSLSVLYLPYYDKLCEALGPMWQPYNGLRSMELQATLYATGRTRSGKIVTNARPGESPHNYGMATDWAPTHNGQPFWPNASDPLWLDYGKAVKDVGLKWGGNFTKFIDCPHNELQITGPWAKLQPVFDQGGLSAVEKFVVERCLKSSEP